MVPEKKRKVVVSKEDAVFWMDAHGQWHNEHGKLEHPKIIKFFNTSIQKDEDGYYLFQVTDELEEKVYFPYSDTAMFVTDVVVKDHIVLGLITGDTVPFEPDKTFSRDDNLYIDIEGHKAKFTERALLKISKFMEEKEGKFQFNIEGNVYPIG